VLLLEALVVGVPVLALAGLAAYPCLDYRPWEAHYKGRPASWWADQMRAVPPVTRARPDGWHEPPAAPPGAGPIPHYALLRGDPASVPVLLELLGRADTHAALMAAWGLRNAEGPSPDLGRLLRELADSGSEPARSRAATLWWRMYSKGGRTAPASDV
jgi:hypothetical protein